MVLRNTADFAEITVIEAASTVTDTLRTGDGVGVTELVTDAESSDIVDDTDLVLVRVTDTDGI